MSLLGKALQYTLRVIRLPIHFVRYIENAQPYQRAVEKDCRRLVENNTACYQMIAELFPRLHHDVQASRQETSQLTNDILPAMRQAARESTEEVQKLKYRYAEFYGAIVEQLKEQNRHLQRLTEQQAWILRQIRSSDTVAIADEANAAHAQLPKAG